MTPLAVSGLLVTVACFSLATWIFIRAPRTLPNHLTALFNVCVGFWGLGTMLVGMAHTPQQAIWAWRIANAGGFPLGMVFVHLALVLSKARNRTIVIATYLFAITAAILCLQGAAMSQTRWMFNSLHYYQANMLYSILFWIWVSVVVWGHYRLYQGYRGAQGLERVQLRLVFYGLATGFIGGSSALLPSFGVPLYPYGNFSIPIYSAIVTYAIVRYGWTDTRVIITRAGLFLAVYVVVLGLPFVFGWWASGWLKTLFGDGWWLVLLGLSTVLATGGPFAYAYLRNQAEGQLLSEQRRYQRTLQRAARGMTQVRSIHRLSELITRVVSSSVRLSHTSLFLWDKVQQAYHLQASHGPKRLAVRSRYALPVDHPLIQWLVRERRILTADEAASASEPAIGREMASLGAGLAIPGLIERRLVGFLALGPRLSGKGFSADDLHAFTMLAHEAAMAIENAASYEELVRANEHLKAASERLLFQERLAAAGQFAMGMAHEVKNPLSAIKTFAQYLPEKYGDKEFRDKFFRIVQSEIDRIDSIVRELSDFAKPAPLQLKPVHLAGLVEDTITLLSGKCLKQGVDLQNSLGSNGLVIQADAAQLKQVLLNVLLNSLEAMPNGGRLEVTIQPSAEHVALQITDTGCGISAEQQAHVWDPFFTTKERGMGLGLAIVKGVVERHGGRITLLSRPGQGTTVEVILPLSA